MSTLLPLLLLGLAGLFTGGAWSLHRQGASRLAVGIAAALAALSLVAGILWLWPAGES